MTPLEQVEQIRKRHVHAADAEVEDWEKAFAPDAHADRFILLHLIDKYGLRTPNMVEVCENYEEPKCGYSSAPVQSAECRLQAKNCPIKVGQGQDK